ncbi:MAG TPA: chaperone modulator CbpM [Flavitalea sp.]|nr:chaperone modulator CbpM [Flavitalea sp.]
MENPGFIEATVFCTVHNIELSFLYELNEYGLIEIQKDESTTWIPEQDVTSLEKYMRLHFDMDINVEGLHAIAHLLRQLEQMKDEILMLKRKLAVYE